MKKLIRIASCSVICIFMYTLILWDTSYAANNVSISAGQSQVAVGSEVYVTVTVPSDADSWTFKVSYSSELSFAGGDKLEPMGFADDNDPRVYSYAFKGESVGTATVSVQGTNGLSINEQDYTASGSVKINVVAVSSSSSGGGSSSSGGSSTGGGSSSSGGSGSDDGSSKPNADSRSSNCSLSSLSINEGSLSPEFDSSTTSYTIDLPMKTTYITVNAQQSDSKASISGAGSLAVQPGENTISVVVTAENGNTKTYTITAYVEEVPEVYTSFEGKNLGVVKNTKKIQAPSGFSETTVTLDGNEIPAWKNEELGVTLVYLIDDDGNEGFYSYSDDGTIKAPYVTFSYNGHVYTFVGIDESIRNLDYLTYSQLEAFDVKLYGFTFNDNKLSGYEVLYLVDDEGNYNFYSYDKENKTLQIFSGAVYSSDGAKKFEEQLNSKYKDELHKAKLIGDIGWITAGVVLLVCIALAYMLYKSNKRARRRSRRERMREASE